MLPQKRKHDGATSDNEIVTDSPERRLKDLKRLPWSRKHLDMIPAQLTSYISELPELTQFFDMGLLITARVNEDAYWAQSLRTWREVR